MTARLGLDLSNSVAMVLRQHNSGGFQHLVKQGRFSCGKTTKRRICASTQLHRHQLHALAQFIQVDQLTQASF